MTIRLAPDDIIAFIVSPFFSAVWCLGIILYAFKWWLSLQWERRYISFEISEATRLIKQLRDSRALAQGFIDVSSRMMMMPRIKMAWKSFSASVFTSDPSLEEFKDEEKPGQLLRTCRMPSDSFNEDTLIYPNLDPFAYGKVQTNLSAFGILGTFCGLAAGIFLARDGLVGGDFKELLMSLQSLLKGASLAFSTAMCGIFTGILFSVSERIAIKKLQAQIHILNLSLLTRLDLVSYEKMMDSSMKANLMQTRSTLVLLDEMRKLNADKFSMQKDTVTALAQELKTALSEVLGTLNEEIRKSAHVLNSEMKKEEQELAVLLEKPFISTLQNIQQIQNDLKKQWEDYCQRFVQVDQSLGQAFSKTNEGIVSFSDKFKDLTHSFDQQLSKSLNSFSSSLGDLHLVLKDIPALCEKLNIDTTPPKKSKRRSDNEITHRVLDV